MDDEDGSRVLLPGESGTGRLERGLQGLQGWQAVDLCMGRQQQTDKTRLGQPTPESETLEPRVVHCSQISLEQGSPDSIFKRPVEHLGFAWLFIGRDCWDVPVSRVQNTICAAMLCARYYRPEYSGRDASGSAVMLLIEAGTRIGDRFRSVPGAWGRQAAGSRQQAAARPRSTKHARPPS